RNATGRRTENAGNSGVDEQRSAASDAVARKSAERPWNTKGKVESAFRAGTERFGAIARDSWPNCARTEQSGPATQGRRISGIIRRTAVTANACGHLRVHERSIHQARHSSQLHDRRGQGAS